MEGFELSSRGPGPQNSHFEGSGFLGWSVFFVDTIIERGRYVRR